MANTLRFKRGLATGIPTALAGEPLFTTDTFDLYIGNGTTNTRFQKYIASGATTQILRGDGSLYTFPLAISSPSNGQVLKYNGTSWVNDSDAGITGSLTTNYLPKATGATTLGNSLLQEASNSIGFSITPSTWSNNTKVFEIGGLGSFFGTFNGTVSGGDVWIGNNTYYDGSLKYAHSSRAAALYAQYTGKYEWYIAPSGTAGNVISFTAAMTLNNSGRLLLNTTSDTGQRLQVVGTSYISGQADFGNAVLVAGPIAAHQTSKGVLEYNANKVSIRAYGATAGTGFIAFNTGGGGGSADTERVRITENGNVLVGITGVTNVDLMLRRNITGTSSTGYSVYAQSTFQSDATIATVFISDVSTQATAYTVSSLVHYNAYRSTLGAGSAITNQYGFYVSNVMTSGTSNYGFYGDLAAATGRWNLFMNGSALNYLNGNLLIGSATDTTEKLQVTGTAKITGATALGNTTITTSVGTALAIYSSATTCYIGMSDSSGDFNYIGSDNGAILFQTPPSSYSTKMTLDRTGNLGLGVTPNTWNSPFKVIQIGGSTSVWNISGVSGFSNNHYNDAVNKYIGNGFATIFQQNTGKFEWLIAPNNTSGAGATATFTQAMTLTAAGRLLLNQISDTGEQLQVTGTAKITDSATFTKAYSNTSDLGVIISATVPGINLRSTSQGRTSLIQNYNANGMSTILTGTGTNNPTIQMIHFNSNDSTVIVGSWGGTSSGDKLQVIGNANISNKLLLGAGTTSNAQINLASSTAPTAPANGDIWFDGTDLKMRIGGVTKTFTLV